MQFLWHFHSFVNISSIIQYMFSPLIECILLYYRCTWSSVHDRRQCFDASWDAEFLTHKRMWRCKTLRGRTACVRFRNGDDHEHPPNTERNTIPNFEYNHLNGCHFIQYFFYIFLWLCGSVALQCRTLNDLSSIYIFFDQFCFLVTHNIYIYSIVEDNLAINITYVFAQFCVH